MNIHVIHFFLGFAGEICGKILNQCKSSPCYNEGTCNVIVDGFVCSCPPGERDGVQYRPRHLRFEIRYFIDINLELCQKILALK